MKQAPDAVNPALAILKCRAVAVHFFIRGLLLEGRPAFINKKNSERGLFMKFLKTGLLKGLKSLSDGLEVVNKSIESANFVGETTNELRRSIANEEQWLSVALGIAQGDAEAERFCSESDENRALYAEAVKLFDDTIFDKAVGPVTVQCKEPDFGIKFTHPDPTIVAKTHNKIMELRNVREINQKYIFDKIKYDRDLQSFFFDALISNGQIAIANAFEAFSRTRQSASPVVETGRSTISASPSPLANPASIMPASIAQATIASHSQRLGIPHLVHFTQVKNIPSIIENGILSVAAMQDRAMDYAANDQLRLDLQDNGISLSISHPNDKLFYKWRRKDPANEWAIILIDPSVMWLSDAVFCHKNAADHEVRRQTLDERKTLDAFQRLFVDVPGIVSRQDQRLMNFDPTDVQAEVLIMERIPPNLLKAIVFESRITLERYRPVLRDIPSSVSADGSGYFWARTYARRGTVH